MQHNYQSFLESKQTYSQPSGLTDIPELNPALFPFQRDIVHWALHRGRAALFVGTGLGKTFICLEWARCVYEETGLNVLILTPLAVAAQFEREAKKFGITAKHCYQQSDFEKGICVTNYQKLEKFDLSGFGGVILDECFPADTLIDCEHGTKYIKDINPGDIIKNASGLDIVADIHRREVPYAVKVYYKDTYFIASPNHPIFTQRGWVGAQSLRPGDHALATRAALPLVRGDFCSQILQSGETTILRDILLSEMADEHTGTSCESPHPGDCGAAGTLEISMVEIRNAGSAGANRADTQSQPNVKSRIEGEILPHIESHEAQTFRAWGQWNWANGTSGDYEGCTWSRLDSGICFVTGSTESKLSHLLQAGFRQSETENRHRNGWSLPQITEGSGHQEGCDADFIRLDGIEILELGHPDLERYRDADGKLYFYDIGATRHPSFSVNGLLVHNSSILKSFDGKTRTSLISAFAEYPYRLAATATPAPNDFMELGNHAEFLGVCSYTEMLSTWFVHDGGETQKWRLKGHAKKDFWAWVSQWGINVTQPADLGYENGDFDLPPLNYFEHVVSVDRTGAGGLLFKMEAQTLQERITARRDTVDDRCMKAAEIINGNPDTWLVWCNLNNEADTVCKLIDDAVDVRGSDTEEKKEQRLLDFTDGKIRVLSSKPSICGYGLNFQHCHNIAFVGLNDSFEQVFQAIRRCWRFGQKHSVNVHFISSEIEGASLRNIQRKQKQADEMNAMMQDNMKDFTVHAIKGALNIKSPYNPTKKMETAKWLRTEKF